MMSKEFLKLTKDEEFIEFYCNKEDKWLQYADWEEKINAVFGNIENAIEKFKNQKEKL